MNKKGITPIIAVVLLLMMTVAAAGAAFYWLTRMQQQAQSGVTGQQQQLIEEASASLSLVSQSYDAALKNLAVDITNSGGRTISIEGSDIVMILEDGDGNAVCAADCINRTASSCSTQKFNCTDATCNGTINPNDVERLLVDIGDCGTPGTGITWYYQLKFQKGATISGSISG
jgi:flagellin-like protein